MTIVFLISVSSTRHDDASERERGGGLTIIFYEFQNIFYLTQSVGRSTLLRAASHSSISVQRGYMLEYPSMEQYLIALRN